MRPYVERVQAVAGDERHAGLAIRLDDTAVGASHEASDRRWRR